MSKAIIEIQAQALEVGDHFDTRCGVADYAWAEITRVEHFTLPGGGDRVEITYRYLLGYFTEETTSRILLPATTVRIRVEVPEAPAAAEQAARRVVVALPKPQDHLRKQPRRRTNKPGTHVQRAIVAYRNRAVLTVEGYLAATGASRELVRKYRSAFGRKVAAAFRAATGTEPAQAGWAIGHGRLVPAFAYQDRALLDGVLAAYETKSPVRARLTDLIANPALIGA